MLLLFAESVVEDVLKFIKTLVFRLWGFYLKDSSVLLIGLFYYLLEFYLRQDRRSGRIL